MIYKKRVIDVKMMAKKKEEKYSKMTFIFNSGFLVEDKKRCKGLVKKTTK